MSKELYANNATTTLTSNGGSINTSITTFNVVSTTGFPATGNFRILIDSELMLVTALSSTTFTVTRAIEGTTAASHTDAQVVYCVLTDAALRALVIQSHGGTTTGARRQFNFVDGGGITWTLTDDSSNEKCDIAATVSTAQSEGSFTTPPDPSTLTWVNQGTASVSNYSFGGFYLVSGNLAASDNNRMLVQSVPGGSSWNFIVRLNAMVIGAGFLAAGVVLRETSSSKFYRFEYANGGVGVSHWSAVGTFGAQDVSAIPIETGGGLPRWMKVNYDGTHYTLYLSGDGLNWMQFYQIIKTTYFSAAADQIGVFVNANNGTYSSGLGVLSWVAA